jgi:hypothetical protein
MQYSDGQVEKQIVVYLDTDEPLTIRTAAEAREVSAALTEAARFHDDGS